MYVTHLTMSLPFLSWKTCASYLKNCCKYVFLSQVHLWPLVTIEWHYFLNMGQLVSFQIGGVAEGSMTNITLTLNTMHKSFVINLLLFWGEYFVTVITVELKTKMKIIMFFELSGRHSWSLHATFLTLRLKIEPGHVDSWVTMIIMQICGRTWVDLTTIWKIIGYCM